MDANQLAALKATTWSVAGYAPLPSQAPIHAATERVLLVSGGEGSGKSLVTSAEIVGRYPMWRLVFLAAPKYESAHKEIDYCYDMLKSIGATNAGLFSRPRNGKAVLRTVDGAAIVTISTEDGAKAVTGTGESPDIIAMVEAGKQGYDIYLACLARVSRQRGRGLLILSGTIEESERWYPELVKRWQVDNADGARAFIVPTWDNTVLYPGGRNDPEIIRLEGQYSAERFMERFGAVPCPPATLVFPEFSYEWHVKPAPYWSNDKSWRSYPVEVCVDPGYGQSAYAVLATQRVGDTVWVIDEIYERGMTVEQIINLAKTREWWSLVSGGVGDYAVRQHQGMASHLEIWQQQAGVYLRNQLVRIPEGINRLKVFLQTPITGEPRIFFDPRCKKLAWEMSTGYKYREVVEGRPTSDEPIDADNHACKAVTYWLVDKFGVTDTPKRAELPSAPPVGLGEQMRRYKPRG